MQITVSLLYCSRSQISETQNGMDLEAAFAGVEKLGLEAELVRERRLAVKAEAELER